MSEDRIEFKLEPGLLVVGVGVLLRGVSDGRFYGVPVRLRAFCRGLCEFHGGGPRADPWV